MKFKFFLSLAILSLTQQSYGMEAFTSVKKTIAGAAAYMASTRAAAAAVRAAPVLGNTVFSIGVSLGMNRLFYGSPNPSTGPASLEHHEDVIQRLVRIEEGLKTVVVSASTSHSFEQLMRVINSQQNTAENSGNRDRLDELGKIAHQASALKSTSSDSRSKEYAEVVMKLCLVAAQLVEMGEYHQFALIKASCLALLASGQNAATSDLVRQTHAATQQS